MEQQNERTDAERIAWIELNRASVLYRQGEWKVLFRDGRVYLQGDFLTWRDAVDAAMELRAAAVADGLSWGEIGDKLRRNEPRRYQRALRWIGSSPRNE
jgi:hypothetical protein